MPLMLILPQTHPRVLNAPPFNPNQQNYFARHHRPRGLPPPDELAARIQEAKTSAKLLLQVVQSTPTNELLNNDLIKEFADRCQSASHSIQGYINSDNPAPDEDTLLTLIETNEQLSNALLKHQRAILQARRVVSNSPSPLEGTGAITIGPPPIPPPRRSDRPHSPPKPDAEDPFADSQANSYGPVDSSNAPNHQVPLQPQNLATWGPPPQQQRQSPAPMGSGFRPTASYVGRKESAANHTTVRGASPVTEDELRIQSGASPVSPMEARAQPGPY